MSLLKTGEEYLIYTDIVKRHREKGHVKTEAEIGVMLQQTKEYQDPPEARSKKNSHLGNMALLTP